MTLSYFDAHCHPQFDAFSEDRADVLARMRAAGVGGLVVGTDAAASSAAAQLAAAHDGLWASAGLHPNHAPDEAFDESAFRSLLAQPKTLAVGECGLDYFRPAEVTDEVKRAQKVLFERHIALAAEAGKPLIIHARPSKGSQDAYQDALAMLESTKKEHGDRLTGDFHFFVGDTDTARRAFELDFTVSYTAVITFARDYDEAVRYAPLDRLLTETDAPYIAPASRRGRRNDPLAVIDVVDALAGIRGEDREIVRAATLRNALRLLRIEAETA